MKFSQTAIKLSLQGLCLLRQSVSVLMLRGWSGVRIRWKKDNKKWASYGGALKPKQGSSDLMRLSVGRLKMFLSGGNKRQNWYLRKSSHDWLLLCVISAKERKEPGRQLKNPMDIVKALICRALHFVRVIQTLYHLIGPHTPAVFFVD